jgi:hypothetical protein
MSDNRISSVYGRLAPDALALVEGYVDRFRTLARAARTPGWEDAVSDIQNHIHDRLDGTPGLADDAARVLAELGEPETLAAAYSDSSVMDAADIPAAPGRPSWLAGRVLGVPYDLRAPTSERYARRGWDPLDRRIFVPKALGIGWTINLGALAVRTHLVRPDDEDSPFAAVPPRIIAATIVVSVLAFAAFAVVAVTSWAGLPERVPTHWGFSGAVDGYGSRESDLLLLSAIAVIPLALAAWVHLRSRPAFNRVGASAVSLALTLVSLSALLQTLFTVRGGSGMWPLWTGLAFALVLPFALFVAVSRVGRRTEQLRDLRDTTGSPRTPSNPSNPSPPSKGHV